MIAVKLVVALVGIGISIYLWQWRRRSKAEWAAYDAQHGEPVKRSGAALRARISNGR